MVIKRQTYAYTGADNAVALASEVSTVAPARLLTLLGQSLKWQQQQGLVQPDTAFDLFRGTTQVVKAEDDAVPTKQYSLIKVCNWVWEFMNVLLENII